MRNNFFYTLGLLIVSAVFAYSQSILSNISNEDLSELKSKSRVTNLTKSKFDFSDAQLLQSQSVSCVDTSWYVMSKGGPAYSWELKTTAGNSDGVSQTFYLNSSIDIKGFQTVYRNDTDHDVDVTISVYDVDALNQPTSLVGSSVVSLPSSGARYYNLMFDSPINVSGNFALAVELPASAGPDSVSIFLNDYTVNEGRTEILSSSKDVDGAWENVGFVGFDFDYIMMPIYEIDLVSNFTANSPHNLSDSLLIDYNFSKVAIADTMFNYAQYLGYVDLITTITAENGDTLQQFYSEDDFKFQFDTAGTYTIYQRLFHLQWENYYSSSLLLCQDQSQSTVDVVFDTYPSFNVSTDAICQGESIDFSNASTGFVDSVLWMITGPETHSFNNNDSSLVLATPGTYTVQLRAYGYGGLFADTINTDFITVNGVAVTYAGNDSITVDISDGVQTTPEASPAGGTFTGGAGVTGDQFDPAVAGIGNHTVWYHYTDGGSGCTDSAAYVYVVTAMPDAGFEMDNIEICVNSTVTFTDTTLNNPTSWSWLITGPEVLNSMDQNPTMTFTTPGTYTVELVATNNSGDDTETKTDVLVVNALPTVSYAVNSSTIDVSDGVVNIPEGDPVGGSFEGNGVSGSTFDPMITGEGTHVVDYIYTDPVTGCSDTAEYSFVVTDNQASLINADFTASVTAACVGQSISFLDLSTGSPDTWAWTVSGPEVRTSGVQNPSFNLNTPGTYTVTLEASSSNGNDTETKTDYIFIGSEPVYTLSAQSPQCFGGNDGVITVSVSGDPLDFTYKVGNNPTQVSNQFTGLTEGSYVITVIDQLTNCFDVQAIAVEETPEIRVEEFVSICSGETYTINGVAQNTSGTYTNTFTAANGCDSIHSVELLVNQTPQVTYNGENEDSVSLTSEIQVIPYANIQGGVFEGTGVTGNFFYPDSAGLGSHEITYTYTDPLTGCSSSDVFTYHVAESIVSVEDEELASVEIFPNPFVNELTVNLNHVNVDFVKLVDLTGKVVFENELVIDNISTINLEYLSKGVYYMVIGNNQTQKVTKVVKQ